MDNKNENCPCKRVHCERHGDCAACKAHHYAPSKKLLPTCERISLKQEKAKKRKNKI